MNKERWNDVPIPVKIEKLEYTEEERKKLKKEAEIIIEKYKIK